MIELLGLDAGNSFLIFCAALLAVCIGLSFFLPAQLRGAGVPGVVDNIEEMAVLAGRETRLAQAVTTDLMARGGIVAGSVKGLLRVDRTDLDTGSAGRTVLNYTSKSSNEFALSGVRAILSDDAKSIDSDLVKRGLFMDRINRAKLRFLPVLPYAALFLICLNGQQTIEAQGGSTGLLIVILFASFALAGFQLTRDNPCTVAGNAIIREAQANASRLRRAPAAGEAGMAVALFGTAVLVGTPWEQIHSMQKTEDSDNDSSGCGGCGD